MGDDDDDCLVDRLYYGILDAQNKMAKIMVRRKIMANSSRDMSVRVCWVISKKLFGNGRPLRIDPLLASFCEL